MTSHKSLASALTEDRLRDHARRSTSPYVYGVPDSALSIKSLTPSSPDRHSVTSAGSTKSISATIIRKVHGFSVTCFSKLRADQLNDRNTLMECGPLPPVPVEKLSAEVVVAGDGVVMEYVWADTYRPTLLSEFICNKERAEEMQQMASKQQCSHFIFEGPRGVGKRTMVLAFLREIFGLERLKTKNAVKKIEVKGEQVTSIDVNIKISSRHVEVNLSQVSGNEKYVIAAFINESRSPLNKSETCDHTNCRAIVLREAEKLSTDAQHYVRWLLEKYSGCNRIFFCCLDASKLQTIKHLCNIVKLQPPSDREITDVLEFIAKKEHIELPHHLAGKITENSMHNLRQAIRSFEASWKLNSSFKENQEILTGWEEDIAAIARNIIEEQSPKQLYNIRSKLKKLIEHDVSPDFIFSTLIVELKKRLDDHLQSQIDALYHEYSLVNLKYNTFLSGSDQPMKSSSNKQVESGKRLSDPKKNVRQFNRIEEFTAKFMSCYKASNTKNAGGMGRG